MRFPFSILSNIVEFSDRYPISSMRALLNSTDPVDDGRPSTSSFILKDRKAVSFPSVHQQENVSNKYLHSLTGTIHNNCAVAYPVNPPRGGGGGTDLGMGLHTKLE